MTYSISNANLVVDKKNILSILQRNLQGISEERYTWNYLNGSGYGAICYIAMDNASGEIIGTSALFLRKIFVKGKVCTAGIAGDFAVDKKYRSFGPALMLQKTLLSKLQNENCHFTYGIPNNLAEPLLLRAGYKKLGDYSRFVKILRTEYKENKSILPSLLSSIISGMTDFALKKFSRENRYKRPSNITVDEPEAFDNRFDVLWNSVSKQFGIIGMRNSKFLTWRYKESPHQNYRIFAITKDGANLLGYIVYYIRENVAYIADMLFDDLDNAIEILILEFSIKMRQRGMGSISLRFLGSERVKTKLKRMNFYEDKRSGTNVLIYPNLPLADFLLDKENWYFLEGDNDV